MTAIRVVSPSGSDGSVQFKSGSEFTGDAKLTFKDQQLFLTGTAYLSGTVNSLGPSGGAITGSITRIKDGRSYIVAGTNVTVTSASDGQITIAAATSGSSTIGSAEDGTYTDGLFTDFTTSTEIGTAIDRFNEVLKALAPNPAPDLDNINAVSYTHLTLPTT